MMLNPTTFASNLLNLRYKDIASPREASQYSFPARHMAASKKSRVLLARIKGEWMLGMQMGVCHPWP